MRVLFLRRARSVRRCSTGTARGAGGRRTAPGGSWRPTSCRCRASTGSPSYRARISTPGPAVSIRGARMNTPGNGPPVSPSTSNGGLERVTLAPVARCGGRRRRWRRTTPGRPGRRPRRAPAGSCPRTCRGRAARRRAGRRPARAAPTCRAACSIVVDSPPGRIERVERAELLGRAHVDGSTPSASSASRCSRNAPCSASTPTFSLEASRHRYQPRSASFTSRASISSPRIASPRPRDTLATMVGVGEVRGGLDDRLGHRRRVGRS